MSRGLKKRWVAAHAADGFVRSARGEGYRSRAAYKLLEIGRRDRLFRPGMVVVDLGAAPGGWSQVAAKAVQPGGRVIAVDMLPMRPIDNVSFIQGNIYDSETLGKVENCLGGTRASLVLSDIAPNLSGIRSVDQARAIELAMKVLDCAGMFLKPGGNLLVKLFMGDSAETFVDEFRGRFNKMAIRKPKASRAQSREIYLMGQTYCR